MRFVMREHVFCYERTCVLLRENMCLVIRDHAFGYERTCVWL